MKKVYEAPTVEKIEFMYRDQVVAQSGGGEKCISTWINAGGTSCVEGDPEHVEYLN